MAPKRPDTGTSIEELAQRRGETENTRGKADRQPRNGQISDRTALPQEQRVVRGSRIRTQNPVCLMVSHEINSGGEVNIEKSMRDAAAPVADARPRESIQNEQNKGKNNGDQAEVKEQRCRAAAPSRRAPPCSEPSGTQLAPAAVQWKAQS